MIFYLCALFYIWIRLTPKLLPWIQSPGCNKYCKRSRLSGSIVQETRQSPIKVIDVNFGLNSRNEQDERTSFMTPLIDLASHKSFMWVAEARGTYLLNSNSSSRVNPFKFVLLSIIYSDSISPPVKRRFVIADFHLSIKVYGNRTSVERSDIFHQRRSCLQVNLPES